MYACSGPAGSVEAGTVCCCCRVSPVWATRWLCAVCPATTLCSACYHSDKHDTEHGFLRCEAGAGPGAAVPVGPRAGEPRLEVRGLYPGATVERGPDWRFGDQDGGRGGRGVVRAELDWEGGAAGQPSAR